MAQESNKMRNMREALKRFIRDTPQLNRIIGDFAFEQQDYDNALKYGGVGSWNASPPILTSVTVETHPSEYLLLLGSAIWLCNSDAIREARNPHQFSDGGVLISEQSKPALYNQALNALMQEYQMMRTQVKMAQNIEGGWGGVPSDYSFV